MGLYPGVICMGVAAEGCVGAMGIGGLAIGWVGVAGS